MSLCIVMVSSGLMYLASEKVHRMGFPTYTSRPPKALFLLPLCVVVTLHDILKGRSSSMLTTLGLTVMSGTKIDTRTVQWNNFIWFILYIHLKIINMKFSGWISLSGMFRNTIPRKTDVTFTYF